MKTTKKLFSKEAIFVLFLLLWGSVLITALVRNPSKSEADARLLTMTQDMDLALLAGGVIDSLYSNAKSGGTLLITNILASSWSQDLAYKYRDVLLTHHWVLKSTVSSLALCKDGVLANIGVNKTVDSAHGLPRDVYGFTMIYNASTKQT